MIDAHISFSKPYSKELLMEYITKAQEKGIDELIVLEPTHKFFECETLYKEMRVMYPNQDLWYKEQPKCSIVVYQQFIDEMKKIALPITVSFGLCVSYLPQHEVFIRQLKDAYPYDVFVGRIEFIDNVAFSWKESNAMMWDKYNTNFLYRRYYETMNALLTSHLFDGVAGFDAIKVSKHTPTFPLQHTYQKLAGLLKEKGMYVENATSMHYRYHHEDNGLQKTFLSICEALAVDVQRASEATSPEDVGRAFF